MSSHFFQAQYSQVWDIHNPDITLQLYPVYYKHISCWVVQQPLHSGSPVESRLPTLTWLMSHNALGHRAGHTHNITMDTTACIVFTRMITHHNNPHTNTPYTYNIMYACMYQNNCNRGQNTLKPISSLHPLTSHAPPLT